MVELTSSDCVHHLLCVSLRSPCGGLARIDNSVASTVALESVHRDICTNPTGNDDGHSHAIVRRFVTERLVESLYRVLCGAISGSERRAEETHDTRESDDVPGTAFVHILEHFDREGSGTQEVYPHQLFDHFIRRFVKQTALADSGIVDEHVDASKRDLAFLAVST